MLLAVSPSFGQVLTGIPPFSTATPSSFDTVDEANLNVHFSIPIFSRPGRGGLNFSYALSYDSSVWQNSYGNWLPYGLNWGWRGTAGALLGYATANHQLVLCSKSGTYYDQYSNWAYQDAQGAWHYFALTISDGQGLGCNAPPMSQSATANDGSGWTLYASMGFSGPPSVITATSPSGVVFAVPYGTDDPTSGAGSLSDPNNNVISGSFSSSSETFYDTLSTTTPALTVGTSGSPSTVKYTYAGPAGPETFTVTYTQKTVQTNFACSNVSDWGPVSQYLITEIDLPDYTTYPSDKYTFTYEATPSYPTNTTGRLASVTLPTGGTISYQYYGANNGITCADGSTATLWRSTPDTASNHWTYAHTETGSAWSTTVTGPTGNSTVYDFQGIYETQRQVYQGSTPLETVNTCYNGATIPCNTTAITLPIANRTTEVTLPNLSTPNKTYTTYNSYGLPTETDEYDWGPSIARKTITTYANNSCGVTNTSIVDRPCTVQVEYASGTAKASATLSYSANGNLLSLASGGLTTSYGYNTNGTVGTVTDVNSQSTSYTYGTGSCNGAYPTKITPPAGPAITLTWDTSCAGGVLTSINDTNGTTSYGYTDPFWRITSITDPTNAVTNISYTPTSVESALNFSSTSTVDILTTLDGLGRTSLTQRRQGQGSASFDSVETTYDTLGRLYQVSPPYSAGVGSPYGGTAWNTTLYDSLNRPSSYADAGGGTIGYTYPKNDVLIAVSSAPNDPNHTKSRQFEYNGLGQLTSVCEITSATGSGSCAQKTSATGFLTQYAYDPLNDLTGVTQNAQSSPTQSRSYSYDGLGRMTQEVNPETGTAHYAYDSDASGNCPGPYKGDLVMREDAVGNYTCYAYDYMHRLTNIGYPATDPYAGVTPNKAFVYDTATVNGVAMTGVAGRLAEAYTGSGSKITDLGFTYNARGDLTDVYQSTPHSSGYYHVSATYWPNGLLNTLNPNLSGQPNWTFSPDPEGRLLSVTASSGQSPLVSGTSYNTFGEVTGMTYGSGDSDAFTLDSAMGRMTEYDFKVNGSTLTGKPAWNTNGTMNQLAITDPFNSNDQQTCNITYDDLGRVASFNCNPNWTHSFSFDAFGNISKTGSNGAENFLPSGYTGNRINSVGGQTYGYDANGNLTSTGSVAGANAYTWDAEGRMVTDTPYGSSATSATYDALGRMVEHGTSSSYTQSLYTPVGVAILMQGQSLLKARIPLSGGAWARYSSTVLTAYWHPDWQGNIRLASSPTKTVLWDAAYASYGETYASSGTVEPYYGGMFQDTSSEVYDAMLRRYQFTQGRWLSPDPAGLGAVDPTNPQTWNHYAYVANNPMSNIDPSGLTDDDDCYYAGDPDCCDPTVEPGCPGPSWPPFPPGGGGVPPGGGAPGGNAKNPPSGPPTNLPPGCEIVNGALWCPDNGTPLLTWLPLGALFPIIYVTVTAQAPNTQTAQGPPSCVGYFFTQTFSHLNPFSPDIAAPVGGTAGLAYSAYKYNEFLKWLPLKYSNAFRVNAVARFAKAVGSGVIVGALTTVDVALLEGLIDEIIEVRNGECQ